MTRCRTGRVHPGRARLPGVTRIACLALLVSLGGCSPWFCAWESHGACIATSEGDVLDRYGYAREEWQPVLDQVIAEAVAFWGSGGIGDWTVVLHDHRPECYVGTAEGCVKLLEKEIHLFAYADCPLAVLPHEIGHAVLTGGDPGHWRGGWDEIDRRRGDVRCWP